MSNDSNSRPLHIELAEIENKLFSAILPYRPYADKRIPDSYRGNTRWEQFDQDVIVLAIQILEGIE